MGRKMKITFFSALGETFDLLSQFIWFDEGLLYTRGCVVLKDAKEDILKGQRRSEKQVDVLQQQISHKYLDRFEEIAGQRWYVWS